MNAKIQIQKILSASNLKITPQRFAVMEALLTLKHHPTAEKITEYIKHKHPNISVGTIYRALETFESEGILVKVATENGVMRYDIITQAHHHLYSRYSDRIEDYFDEELNELIERYFSNKKIPNFTIEEFKLEIIGKFKETN